MASGLLALHRFPDGHGRHGLGPGDTLHSSTSGARANINQEGTKLNNLVD
jgi:hypothetical protein